MTTAPTTEAPATSVTRSRARQRSQAGPGYAFLAPSVLLLGLFVLLPLGWAALLSLQQTDGFGAGRFVGLDNYARILEDPRFWRALGNTVLFTVIVTPLSMLFGLGAALLLDSALPARAAFRTVLILPMAVSGVATGLLGLLVFDENTGVVDGMLAALHLPEVAWQSGGTGAFVSVVVMTLWWRVGFNMLIYLTGLQAVDPLLHETAMLDGAGWWQRVRHVTVPMLRPSTAFLLVINVIYSFQVFDVVFVLTGGGPRDATSVLVTYAYETGFTQRDQGYAAALGMVLLAATLTFTAVQWRAGRAREES